MELTAITGAALAKLGPWGLLVLLVAVLLTSLLKGTLVAGSVVRENESRYQNEITRLSVLWEARLDESRQRERDWQTAFDRSEERADVLTGQLDRLSMCVQSMDEFMRDYLRRP